MNPIQKKSLKQLLWIGIGAIVMFFAGLTSAYIVRKAEGNWLEFILPNWFLYSTVTIVLSSILLIIARSYINKEKPIDRLVLTTFLLGMLFSYFQFRGWQELTIQGVFLTGEGSNVAGSFLYVITLAHLAHLVGGLIALVVSLINARRGKYTSNNYLGFELTSNYWHFLGLLWVYLFFFLKFF